MKNILKIKNMIVLKILVGLLILKGSVSAAAFAERYAPEIDLFPSYSETTDLNQPEDLTRVEDLSDQPTEGYLGMQLSQPQPGEIVPILKGKVDIDKEFTPDVVFDDMHTIGKGEKLILTIMDMIATGYSQGGDEFHARIKKAVEREGKILVPKGTLVKGHVRETDDPGKNFSKRGRIVLDFDYILMPDGRKIPFKSDYTKGDNAIKAVGRAVGMGIGGAVGGAVSGVLVGLKFGGIYGAAATNGVTLIAGGGLGTLAGLERGLSRSGNNILLNEGDEIKVALQEPLSLPAMIIPPDTENEILDPGLHVKITDYSLGRDPFKVENQINLTLQIDNQTDLRFGSFDIALMDEYNTIYAVSPFGEDNMLVFAIDPKSQITGKFAFSVKSPDLRHYLIFYKPYTREIMAKISLLTEFQKVMKSK